MVVKRPIIDVIHVIVKGNEITMAYIVRHSQH